MWIPVKERLPKDEVEVLATIKYKNERPYVQCVNWGPVVDMETGEIIGAPTFVWYIQSQDYKECVNLTKGDYKILAWMPFPKPFEDEFRVIVAGSRTMEDYEFVKEHLDKVFSKHKPTSIVCGEAKGADALGRKYAIEKHIKIDSFPADWTGKGKQAGYLRNEQMAQNADALIAFWNGTSAGTKHMINTARNRNLQVRVIKF